MQDLRRYWQHRHGQQRSAVSLPYGCQGKVQPLLAAHAMTAFRLELTLLPIMPAKAITVGKMNAYEFGERVAEPARKPQASVDRSQILAQVKYEAPSGRRAHQFQPW